MGSFLGNIPTPEGDSEKWWNDGDTLIRGRIHTRKLVSTLRPTIDGCLTIITDSKMCNSFNYHTLCAIGCKDSISFVSELSPDKLGFISDDIINSSIESRIIFYRHYEELARLTDALQQLIKLVYVDKKDVVLAGKYMNNKSDSETTIVSIRDDFFDITNNFCHEQALHAILLCYKKEELLPWYSD